VSNSWTSLQHLLGTATNGPNKDSNMKFLPEDYVKQLSRIYSESLNTVVPNDDIDPVANLLKYTKDDSFLAASCGHPF